MLDLTTVSRWICTVCPCVCICAHVQCSSAVDRIAMCACVWWDGLLLTVQTATGTLHAEWRQIARSFK